MKTSGVGCLPKFGLLIFLGHPSVQGFQVVQVVQVVNVVQVVRVAWMVRVVLVSKFVNVYGLHGLNNQII